MATTKIAFGEWLPDQPGVTGAVTDAKNCYPVANGYAPFPSVTAGAAGGSFGGGGSGGGKVFTPAGTTGGAGAGGIVIVEEFY